MRGLLKPPWPAWQEQCSSLSRDARHADSVGPELDRCTLCRRNTIGFRTLRLPDSDMGIESVDMWIGDEAQVAAKCAKRTLRSNL